MRFLLFVVVIFALSVPCHLSARTWYITPAGTGDAPTIQAGIDSAGVGDTVLVACGTYYEHDIVMKSGICLRSETGEADCAIVDARGRGRVIYCDEVDGTTRIEGFTITGGRLSGFTPEGSGAGVMCCNSSSPVIGNCLFVWNSASAFGYGGGIFCGEISSPAVNACTFTDNSAGVGGGVGSVSSSPVFLDCTFEENMSATDGGGFWCEDGAPTLAVCDFSRNSSAWGGGGVCCVNGSVALGSCRFSENAAENSGGALYLRDASSAITDCVLAMNTALSKGGGIRCRSGASVAIARSTFFGNSAPCGGAISCYYSTVSLEKTIVSFSSEGGAVDCEGNSPASVVCCDVYGNVGGDHIMCRTQDPDGFDFFSLDPLFCDPGSGDYRLNSESPCVAPQLDPTCGDYIGAFGVGCGATGVGEGRALPGTWGLVRHLFEPAGCK